ncbi:gamma-tubulin complex component 3 [Enteropsectra breve]|nr:gamma-tubulin complex component 3 [Enteropsectra breve]
MEKNIEKLVRALYKDKTPPSLLVERMYKYAEKGSGQTPPVEPLLAKRSEYALDLYKNMKKREVVDKLVYVLLKISEDKQFVQNDLKIYLKKGALGFNVPYFNANDISSLKSKIPCHIYSILNSIYSYSLIYKRIRIEQQCPQSQTHAYFLDKICHVLDEYERSVQESSSEFLSFMVKMHPVYFKLKKIAYLNEMIVERRYLRTRGTQHPNSLKMDLFPQFKELLEYSDVAYRVYNKCIVSYFSTGGFSDPYNEFFIKNHVVDYGLIPPLLSPDQADTICYIGKYTCFLKSIGSFALSEREKAHINSIDISSEDLSCALEECLRTVNRKINENFIQKYEIMGLLRYIHDVFLFGRVDFSELLFESLKQLRKPSRKNFIGILEDSLETIFPGCPFNKLIDIFVKDFGLSPASEANGLILSDSFSLYCNLNYPLTVLLEEEIVLKLVYIFKFIWKLKRVDHLCRRAGIIKYTNLAFKLSFYVFNEVLSEFTRIAWKENGMALDTLKMDINRAVDVIMKRLFINTEAKKIEFLLYHMENAMVEAVKTGNFNEEEVAKSLREFYEFSKKEIENTYLFDLRAYIM